MNFADEFEKLMTDTGRRHADSPNEIVAAGEAFVAECTEGYGWGIYEYRNELGVRSAIDSALRSPALASHPEFRGFEARVAEIDARFAALVTAGPEVEGPDRPWWIRRLPPTGGEELAGDAKRLYGAELTVV